MKIRSIEEFEDFVSKEYSWRRKELTNLKNISLSGKSQIKETLIRSSISLLYSHWEGFVKNTSIAYCEYINYQGIKYINMKSNFHVCALINEFQGQYPHSNFKSALSIVKGDALPLSKKCKINSEKYIDTKSNLNSDVFKEITLKIGIDYTAYELKEKLIDERFLGLRNAISHGEYRKVEESDFLELYYEITKLIEMFKNQLLNAANQKSYLEP